MKKFLAMLLTLCMVLAFAGCAQKAPEATEAPDQEATTEAPAGETPAATEEDVKSEGVMTYAEYVAAELESQVTVETYVQAKQSWWEDKATVYSQDKDGAYFLYNMACSQEDYDKLVPGTKIKVTGYKSEWSGEIEIIDATFEIEGYLIIPVCVEFLRHREFPEPTGAVAAGKERKQHTQRQYEADKLFIHTNPLYLLWIRRPLSCCGISETAL